MPGTITPIIGPSIDDLGHWGNMDTLPWSLDSPLWDDAAVLALAINEAGQAGEKLVAQAGASRVAVASGMSAEVARPALTFKVRANSRATSSERVIAGVTLTFKAGASSASGEKLLPELRYKGLNLPSAALSGEGFRADVLTALFCRSEAVSASKMRAFSTLRAALQAKAESLEACAYSLRMQANAAADAVSEEKLYSRMYMPVATRDKAASSARLRIGKRGHGWTREPAVKTEWTGRAV